MVFPSNGEGWAMDCWGAGIGSGMFVLCRQPRRDRVNIVMVRMVRVVFMLVFMNFVC